MSEQKKFWILLVLLLLSIALAWFLQVDTSRVLIEEFTH